MNARRAYVLVVTAVAAGLVAFAAVMLTRPAPDVVRLAGAPVATLRNLEPTEPQFGDTVVATLDVFVDTRRVDPSSVVLHADFAPFAVTSTARSIRHTGGVAILRVVDRLDCLGSGCLPQSDAATFRFPRLRVTYPGGTLVAAWPALRVHARTQAADVAHPVLRVGAPVADTSYRLPPTATGWTLLAIALVAALGGLGLLIGVVLPSSPFARRRRGSELERILGELASANGDASRRRTVLEQLAHELEPLDEPLSFESRVLAWAPEAPEPDTISDLTQRVRAAVGR